MKRLVDQIVDSHIASQNNTQILKALAGNLQVDEDKVLLGTPQSYIEVGGEGQIALVSGGQRIEFADLLRFADLVNLFLQDGSDGTDEDYDGIDPELEAQNLDDNEALLELDSDPLPSAASESTTLLELVRGSLNGTQGWNIRRLSSVNPTRDWLTLGGGLFTLQPGNYSIIARCPAVNCDSHQAKITAGTQEWLGSAVQTVYEFVDARDRQQALATDSWVFASVSITEATEFTLQHYVAQVFPFGVLGAGGGSPSLLTIYSQVMITRLSEIFF